MIPIMLISLPGGEFEMGGDKFEDESPRHRVRVAPFAIGKYPVTQAQWREVMGTNPSRFEGEMRPVENVSWDDVQQFLQRLGSGFRLPTEAEWEYAARGGTTTEYSFGDDISNLSEYAWFDDGDCGDTTHPVGQKKPNPFGLYDVHGNVWEWCEDDWHDDYNGAPGDGEAWVNTPRTTARVIRGGGWDSYAVNCASPSRIWYAPGDRNDNLGFRVAISK